MAEDRVAELRRLDEEVATAKTAVITAQRVALKLYASLLADEMQATGERLGMPSMEDTLQYYFGDNEMVLKSKKDTYFGQVAARAYGGSDLRAFVNVFNEELEAREVSVRLKTEDASWYSTFLTAA